MPRYSKLVVDLDGTLCCGSEAIPGAVDAMRRLRESCSILFLSNNGNRSPDRLAERLERMGFEAHADEVVCSLSLIVAVIRSLGQNLRVLTLSSGDLSGALEEAGQRIVNRAPADVVVAGVDFDITYETLARALEALQSGAILVGANEDATYPTGLGPRPAAGAFVGAMRGMGFAAAWMCGKPDAWAMRRAFDLRGFAAGADCLMVGDRVDADILGAQTIGIDSALVLTGVSTLEDARHLAEPPTYEVESIERLSRILDGEL